MTAFFGSISKLIYSVRDFLWKYPDTLFFGQGSLSAYIKLWYSKTRPFSHFLLSGIVYLSLLALLFIDVNAILRINTNQYIEGIIVGIDETTGELKGVDRLNPLIPTNAQIEKDISALIYEELLKVNQNGEVDLILLESYGEIKPGNHYRFKLLPGVKWHDGEDLTTEDIEETINLLKRFHKNNETASNFSSVVTNQLDDIKIIDTYTFELKLKSPDAVLPTFLESISFKILPTKHILELDDISVFSSDIDIIQSSVGTGKYELSLVGKTSVRLLRNDNYYGKLPGIKNIKFELFPDELTAYGSLSTSKIHAIAGISTQYVESASNLNNYILHKSNVMYNQYWALYFNLNPNSGNKILQSQNVRQALSHGVNKQEILKVMMDMGEQSYSSIPKSSFVFNEEADWLDYNPRVASRILEKEGWLLDPEDGIRKKDNQPLEFMMVLIDNNDRRKVANVIKTNLAEIGVSVQLEIDTIDTVVDKYILPKHFDTLLYGQTTFIDPDRYELFHSSQRGNVLLDGAAGSENTGLNISGFESQSLDSKIEDKELIKVPKVDTLLEDGRRFLENDERVRIYGEFQEILSKEVPVIFLYHPIYPYIINQRVYGVDTSDMVSLEDRFRGIASWRLEI